MALAVNTSQVPIQVVGTAPAQEARTTQMVVQVVYSAVQDASTSQVPLQVVYPVAQEARTTQFFAQMIALPVLDGPRALIPVWPVTEKWTWKTTVAKGYSGREQRMALRTEPFVEVEYDLALLSEDDRSVFYRNMFKYIGTRLFFPLWQYATEVTQVQAVNDTVLKFDPTKTDMRAGEHIALFNSDLSVYNTYLISSVDADGVTLDSEYPLLTEVLTSYKVAPAPDVRIEDESELVMQRFHGMAKIAMVADAARTIRRPNQSETLDTYNGKVILDIPYLVNSGVRETYKLNVTKMDNGLSNPTDIPGWLKPQITMDRHFLIQEGELDFWRQVAYEVKGNLKSFYMPSGRSDFSITTTPSLGATVLETTDDFVNDIMESNAFRTIKITTQNGVIYRTVTEVNRDFGGTTRLTLSLAIGSGAGDNVITKVEFMPLVRVASDAFIIRHMPFHKEIRFTIATVES